MLKEAIKEATTLEEAKRAAAAELGLEEDQLQFEILQMPQKKKDMSILCSKKYLNSRKAFPIL